MRKRGGRPVIGITSSVGQTRFGVWDIEATLVARAYLQAVEAAGGLPVVLAPVSTRPEELIGLVDGLILSGGGDIDPARYGSRAHPRTCLVPTERDESEHVLARAAFDMDLPVLGVCRGAQVMAVVRGGTLAQHLPDLVGHHKHLRRPGTFGTHRVRLAPGSRVHDILGGEVDVSSYHHQAVAEAGALTCTAWADDGVIEAVEDTTRRFALGVQWHPEEDDDPRLFEALVHAAAGRTPADEAVRDEATGWAGTLPRPWSAAS